MKWANHASTKSGSYADLFHHSTTPGPLCQLQFHFAHFLSSKQRGGLLFRLSTVIEPLTGVWFADDKTLIIVLIQRVEDKMNLGRYVSVLLYLKICALSTINDVSSQSSKWCDPTTPDSASRQILHAKNSHPNIHSFSVPHVNDNDLVYVFILMSSRYIRVSKLEVKVIKLSQIRWCQF